MLDQNKDIITYQVEGEDKNAFKPFELELDPKATVANAREQIALFLNISKDEFDIKINNIELKYYGAILNDINPRNSPLILQFKPNRYLTEGEIERSIVIVKLPIHKQIEIELRKIFQKEEKDGSKDKKGYGSIEKMILEKNGEKYYTAILVMDSVKTAEKARLYPEKILNNEVIIMKASSIPNTVGNEKQQSKTEKLFLRIKKYDETHFDIIPKLVYVLSGFGYVLGGIGDFGMKIANKVDETYNLSYMLTPIMNSASMKIVTIPFSYIGGLVLHPIIVARDVFGGEKN